MGWPGSCASVRPSWPLGMREKDDWPVAGEGRAAVVKLDGRARKAERMMN
jgi:hypothetical protein